MRLDKPLLVLTAAGLLLALASGCAAPAKSTKSTTDLLDGASATAGTLPSKPAADELLPPAADPVASACDVSHVLFAFDSATLDEAARQALRDAAACLQQRRTPEIAIEGHCDERGTAAYNLALGGKRAAAVKGYLADLGVKADMQTVSFGKELPLVKGTGEQVWKENRRAELRQPGERRTDGVVVSLR